MRNYSLLSENFFSLLAKILEFRPFTSRTNELYTVLNENLISLCFGSQNSCVRVRLTSFRLHYRNINFRRPTVTAAEKCKFHDRMNTYLQEWLVTQPTADSLNAQWALKHFGRQMDLTSSIPLSSIYSAFVSSSTLDPRWFLFSSRTYCKHVTKITIKCWKSHEYCFVTKTIFNVKISF